MDENWKETIEALVRQAHAIVVHAQTLTPGLLWELACVRRHERLPSTLLVLPNSERGSSENDDRLDKDALRAGLWKFAGGGDEPHGLPATKDAAPFVGFTRVMFENELQEGGFAAAPLFADLLAEIDAIAALDPEERVRRAAIRIGLALLPAARLSH